jgi:FMN phosphatase YigB (HAD superfamily)
MVVFDIGGVLVRIAPWAEAHAACGHPPEQLPPLDGFLPRLSLLNHAYDRGEIEPDVYEARVAEAAEGKYLPQEVRRIHAAVCTTEFPGLHAVFDDLEVAGLETGILSNTNVMHWERLSGIHDGGREYPLISRAAHPHASFLLKYSKPDPRIYHAFARATGVSPSEILFFDDLGRNVDGARAAGWWAEQVDPEALMAPQLRSRLQAHGVLA